MTRPRDPRCFVAYSWSVAAATLALSVLCLVHLTATPTDWAKLAMLAVLATAYEEGGKRAARLKSRLGADLTLDMTSVWGVAAAVVLPYGLIALLLFVLGGYIWLRQERPNGKPGHRVAFNASNAVLSALTAAATYDATARALHSLPIALATAVPILAAIVAHGIVNRALATVAIVLLGVRGSNLLGSVHDNLVELATLCLGGLTALAVFYVPWLTVLAIAPMVSLQRGALVRELETAATVDAKTGLYNAITWEQVAQRELARAARTSTSTAIIIVDLDRFKLVNDQFGHLAGDRVLHGVGQRLLAEVREYDTVGRFGGEEFVAVLPNASDADALVVAERIRSRINDLRVGDFVDAADGVTGDTRLAVSVGVARAPVDGTDLTEVLHAADAALYRAKAAGRNRVMLAPRGSGSADDVARLSV